MKPEDAKARDLDDLFEHGWEFKAGRIDGAGWFTAKETAEIAAAYCRDYINSTVPYQKGTKHLQRAIAWKNLFKEWSK